MAGEVDAYFDIWFSSFWFGDDPEDPDDYDGIPLLMA